MHVTRKLFRVSIVYATALPLAIAVGQDGQKPTAATAVSSVREDPTYRAVVPRISVAPRIDGQLNDSIWKQARRLSGFTEVEPQPGAIPKDSTVAFVAYDRENLYVAVVAYANPATLRAPITARDASGVGWGYDGITLRLDTYNDARRAYVLQVNPRGVQTDGTMVEGGNLALAENFVWGAAGQVDAEGYVVEFAIPFNSLSFPTGDSLSTGFNIIRERGNVVAKDSWVPRKRGSPCDICQEGLLTGIVNVSTKKTVDLVPYISGAQAGTRDIGVTQITSGSGTWPAASPDRWRAADAERRMGADVRLLVAPSYVLNATINPDFSQIEASPEQVRVNERFAVFYQELRPFFTTAGDAFAMAAGTQLFYSRDITDPTAGARLTGKSGPLSIAALYARDRHPVYFNYRGYEASSIDLTLPGQADIGILRAKRDIWGDSYVGVMLIDREHDAAANRVFATDMRLRVGHTTLKLDASRSFDRAPYIDEPSDSAGLCREGFTPVAGSRCLSTVYGGSTRWGSRLRSQLSYATTPLIAEGWYGRTTPGFRSQIGRVDRVGIEDFGSALTLLQYPTALGLRNMREVLKLTLVRTETGKLLDYEVALLQQVSFRKDLDLTAAAFRRRTTFVGHPFDTRVGHFKVITTPSPALGFEANFTFGTQPIFDFARPRVGRSWNLNILPAFHPIPALTILPAYTHTRVMETNGITRVADAGVFRLSTQYQYSPALGFKLSAQHSDQWSGLVSNPFAQEDAYYRSSLVTTYEVVPTAYLYVTWV
jgi:hypothetical protein